MWPPCCLHYPARLWDSQNRDKSQPAALSRRPVWLCSPIGRGGRQRRSEEAGKMKRKARGDGAIGEGVNNTTMLTSDLAESANSIYSTLKRSESSGSMITVTPHTWSCFDLVLGKLGSVSVSVKKKKKISLSPPLSILICFYNGVFSRAEREKWMVKFILYSTLKVSLSSRD